MLDQLKGPFCLVAVSLLFKKTTKSPHTKNLTHSGVVWFAEAEGRSLV